MSGSFAARAPYGYLRGGQAEVLGDVGDGPEPRGLRDLERGGRGLSPADPARRLRWSHAALPRLFDASKPSGRAPPRGASCPPLPWSRSPRRSRSWSSGGVVCSRRGSRKPCRPATSTPYRWPSTCSSRTRCWASSSASRGPSPNAAGKQFEISLILLRQSFQSFGHLDEPIVWDLARDTVLQMLGASAGALLIFVVLISLRYSSTYPVVFRNSGLAVSTVLLRPALSASPYASALRGVVSALFALALTVAYNAFSPRQARPEAADVG